MLILGILFRRVGGAPCWIMTEWEWSHWDKGEGGRQSNSRQEKETDEGAGNGGEFELMLSVTIATKRGQPGYGFIQRQTITELMGEWLREDIYVSVYIHQHA